MKQILTMKRLGGACLLAVLLMTATRTVWASGGSGNSGSGTGSGGSGSGNSGSGGSGNSGGSDDNGGSGNSGSGNSGSGSSGSGNSGSGNSGSGSSGGSGDSNGSSSGNTNSSSTTQPASTQVILQGKTRTLISGFQAEFGIRYEVRVDRRKFEAEASNLNLGAGTQLSVCLGATSLGSITLNSLNMGELELDTRNGNTIPSFAGGETISLKRGGCAGTAVISATFGSDASVPSVSSTSRTENESSALINNFVAKFRVRFEERTDRTRFNAEVEDLNMPAGTNLSVCIGGSAVGTITLNAFNQGELELDSRLGHTVPAASKSPVVELRQGGCTGQLLLSVNSASAGSTTSQTAQNIEIEGKTRQRISSFEAEFSIRFEQRLSRAKFRAEVSNLNMPQGTRLLVCSANTALGAITLDAFHFGELELDSSNNQNVPAFAVGDVVKLVNGSCANATQMMSASFTTVR